MKKIFPLSFLLGAFALASAAPVPPVASLSSEKKVRQLHRSSITRSKKSSPAPVARKTAKLRQALPAGVEVYGWLGYTDFDDVPEGLYQFTPSGSQLKWADPKFTYVQDGWEMLTSWLSADGNRICGYSADSYWGMIQDMAYVEYDFASGAILTEDFMDASIDPVPNVSALNPADGYVYVMGFDAEDNPFLGRAKADDPAILEPVREFESMDDLLCSMTYCPDDGFFYAVTFTGKFVRFDTGFNMTTVIEKIELPDLKTYITGLCYSQADHLFYWNVNRTADVAQDLYFSELYTINAASKELTKVADFIDNEEYISLYSPTVVAAEGTPESPVFKSDSFLRGALSGDFVFTLPLKTVDGGDLPASLAWTAYLDGSKYKEGTGAPGADVTLNFTNLATGLHSFALDVAVDDKVSRRVTENRFIGFDTPLQPANVTLSNTQISWDPVSAGVNGGYVDADNMKYEVYLNGESIGTFLSTSAPVVIPESGKLTAWQAMVEAISEGQRSQAGVSPKLVAGDPLELDVDIRPTREQWNLCTWADGNDDGQSWVLYDEADDSFFNSQFSKSGEADDYLFFPAINFPDASAIYEVSFDARGRSPMFTEEFVEVLIGTKPEIASMTSTVMEKTQLVADWKNYSAMFHVPAPGVYYVAVRQCSSFDQYGVFLKNVNICKSDVSDKSPAAASEVSAEALPGGELKAKVSLTFPTASVNGEALAPDAALVAEVTGTETVAVSGVPGGKAEVTVPTRQGLNYIQVRVKLGDLIGPAAEAQVYTGVVAPGFVRNLRANVEDDNITVHLTWDAPEVGDDGGYIKPEDVWYDVFIYSPGGWTRIDGVSAGTTDFYFDGYEYEGKPLEIVQLGVRSLNMAGTNNKVVIAPTTLGTPYALPMQETFDARDENGYCVPTAEPWLMLAPDSSYDSKWGFSSLAKISDAFAGIEGGALVGEPAGAGSKGMMLLPKFSTLCEEGEEVVFTLRTYTGPQCASTVKILAETYDDATRYELATITPSKKEEWTDTSITLPAALLNRNWICAIVDVTFNSAGELFLLDKYGAEARKTGSVGSLTDHAPKAWSVKGEIRLSGLNGSSATIYNAAGQLVTKTGAERVSLPVGTYIVTLPAGNAVKLQVP